MKYGTKHVLMFWNSSDICIYENRLMQHIWKTDLENQGNAYIENIYHAKNMKKNKSVAFWKIWFII